MTAPVRLAARALVLLALLALLPAAITGQSSTNVDLLLAFRETFSNRDSVLSSWGSTPAPCDGTWLGLQCSSYGDVTGM